MKYIKATDSLPKECTPVWVRINGSRPRKMYLLYHTFYYYNKMLNMMYCGIGENVLWRYCDQEGK